MPAPSDPPLGLIRVPLPKGCGLLLTEREFVAGIRRGKWWRRREAMVRREAKTSTTSNLTSAGRWVPAAS